MNTAPTTGRYRFLFSLLLEHRWSYLGGALMVVATLWMTLTIPQLLERAINISCWPSCSSSWPSDGCALCSSSR